MPRSKRDAKPPHKAERYSRVTDRKKFDKNWDRIFGKRKKPDGEK